MIPSGTPEWFAARLGKLTASRIADALARTKSGWGASRTNYMAELVAERLTGVPAETYVSAAMQRGADMETEARAAYEFCFGIDVAPGGFIAHPRIADSGASPDGLVGDDGLVEFKCPNTSTHIDTLLGAPIAQRYVLQMQWQMACTDRTWCDFVSYDPRMPEAMRLHATRVARDAAMIAALERDVRDFLSELSAKVDELRRRYDKREAA